jgi:hypothetical protein
MFDLRKIFDLGKIFAVHKDFLKSKIYCTTKSLSNICQHFSCLLDMGTAKICKNFNSHDGFLRADQSRAKNRCQIGWIGRPILQVAQKATVRF